MVGVTVPKVGDGMEVTEEGPAESSWGQSVGDQSVVDTAFSSSDDVKRLVMRQSPFLNPIGFGVNGELLYQPQRGYHSIGQEMGSRNG